MLAVAGLQHDDRRGLPRRGEGRVEVEGPQSQLPYYKVPALQDQRLFWLDDQGVREAGAVTALTQADEE